MDSFVRLFWRERIVESDVLLEMLLIISVIGSIAEGAISSCSKIPTFHLHDSVKVCFLFNTPALKW